MQNIFILPKIGPIEYDGGVAQMVERSLSMREVPGSIPGASTNTFSLFSSKILLFLFYTLYFNTV